MKGPRRKDGKALGLPVTLVIDKEGCGVTAVEGGVKWDSAQAAALVDYGITDYGDAFDYGDTLLNPQLA